MVMVAAAVPAVGLTPDGGADVDAGVPLAHPPVPNMTSSRQSVDSFRRAFMAHTPNGLWDKERMNVIDSLCACPR